MASPLEPLFIDQGGTRLFAVLHMPDGQARRAALFLPPLFEEKKPSYRPLRDVACRLCADGAAVLRFDFRGTGDSGGTHRELTLKAMREDAAAAAAWLREKTPGAPLVLVGLRAGASLALMEAKSLGADAVAALAPVVKGRRFVSQMVRKKQVRAMLTAGEARGAGKDVASSRQAGEAV